MSISIVHFLMFVKTEQIALHVENFSWLLLVYKFRGLGYMPAIMFFKYLSDWKLILNSDLLTTLHNNERNFT